jgi:hypothetical protein
MNKRAELLDCEVAFQFIAVETNLNSRDQFLCMISGDLIMRYNKHSGWEECVIVGKKSVGAACPDYGVNWLRGL